MAVFIDVWPCLPLNSVTLSCSSEVTLQKYVHSSTNYTLTDTSSSLLRSGSSSAKTGKGRGKCIFESCGWLVHINVIQIMEFQFSPSELVILKYSGLRLKINKAHFML